MLAIHGFVLLACGIATRRMVGSADHRQEEPLTSEVDGLGKRHWSALAALTLVALALRLWRLDSGLWLDEVSTLLDFGRVPLAEVVTMFPSQNQHMLYSVLMHLPLALWGESAWALRLPAVFIRCRRCLGSFSPWQEACRGPSSSARCGADDGFLPSCLVLAERSGLHGAVAVHDIGDLAMARGSGSSRLALVGRLRCRSLAWLVGSHDDGVCRSGPRVS